MGQKRATPRSRSVLPILAALLIASALLRGLDGTEEMLAQVQAASADDQPDENARPQVEQRSPPPASLEELMETLKTREAALAERESRLEERARALALAETEIEANLTALVAAEAQLERTLSLADGAVEKDIGRLTRVYESMKPKEASVLFEQMDPSFAAGFLARMNPEFAAGVMAGLTPDTAYAISILLASRNHAAPVD